MDFDSDDDDDDGDDDELGRQVNASPIITKSNKKDKLPFGRDNSRFEPKMSEVVEETEPESSFKETDRHKRKIS